MTFDGPLGRDRQYHREPVVDNAYLDERSDDVEYARIEPTNEPWHRLAFGNQILRCDNCGRWWPDTQENLLQSCDCGRFLQRVDWLTAEEYRQDCDEYAYASWTTTLEALAIAGVELS